MYCVVIPVIKSNHLIGWMMDDLHLQKSRRSTAVDCLHNKQQKHSMLGSTSDVAVSSIPASQVAKHSSFSSKVWQYILLHVVVHGCLFNHSP